MWEFIDKIVYINLDHRQDRRDVMAKFFEEGGMPSEKIIRFSAVKHTRGAIGCLTSHTEVLRMAKKEGWKNVLILEDDLQISKEFCSYAKNALTKYLNDNDVWMISGTHPACWKQVFGEEEDY